MFRPRAGGGRPSGLIAVGRSFTLIFAIFLRPVLRTVSVMTVFGILVVVDDVVDSFDDVFPVAPSNSMSVSEVVEDDRRRRPLPSCA